MQNPNRNSRSSKWQGSLEEITLDPTTTKELRWNHQVGDKTLRKSPMRVSFCLQQGRNSPHLQDSIRTHAQPEADRGQSTTSLACSLKSYLGTTKMPSQTEAKNTSLQRRTKASQCELGFWIYNIPSLHKATRL